MTVQMTDSGPLGTARLSVAVRYAPQTVRTRSRLSRRPSSSFSLPRADLRYTPDLPAKLLLSLFALSLTDASGQWFVSGLAGVADLTAAAAVRANPPAASSYDPKLGSAWNVSAGYHFNDWLSGQVGYTWNRNRIVSTAVAGASFEQQEVMQSQVAVGADFMLYFRPRSRRLRPYVAVGPALVRVASAGKPGFRAAVGLDLMSRSGWGFRYTFGETMTANPFAEALHPPASKRLMNFQNLFGFVKHF